MKAELIEVNNLVKAVESEWVTVRGRLTRQEGEDKINSCVSPETHLLREQEEAIRGERDVLWSKQRRLICKLAIIRALEIHEHECPDISELHQKYVIEQVEPEFLRQDLQSAFQDYVNIYASEFI